MTNDRGNPRRYDDIIGLPHHVSAVHPQMALYDRAAQFAPFKALTGYEDEAAEAARLTDARVELDSARIEQLDARLRLLAERLSDAPTVSITVFRPDGRKEGGSYEAVTAAVKRIDAVRRVLILRDGREIAFGDIYGIEGDIF